MLQPIGLKFEEQMYQADLLPWRMNYDETFTVSRQIAFLYFWELLFFIITLKRSASLMVGAQWTGIVTTIAIEMLKSGMVEAVICVQR